MNSALVIGAAGFLGSWLCRELADRGVPVPAVVRRPPPADGLFAALGLASAPGVRLVVAGGVDAVLVSEASPDAVFNLAGMSQVEAARSDPVAAFESNSRAVWLLLDVLRHAAPSAAVVVASTDGVYGEASGRPSVEDDLPMARGPYEMSKLAGEAAASGFAALGQPVTVARLGNVYGFGDANASRLIPGLFDAARQGVAPRLRGDGRSIRGYLNVRDAVAGLLALADHACEDGIRGQPVNLVSERGMSSLEMARLVMRIAGRPDLEAVVGPPAAGETSIRVSSAARARERLGWKERIPLEQGLRTLWERQE